MMHRRVCSAAPLMIALSAAAQTPEPEMMGGLGGYVIEALLTVGETVPHIDAGTFQLTGLPDGIGAWTLDPQHLRLLVNHEFSAGQSTPYTLANGTVIPSGARVSLFDLDTSTMTIVRGGQGYTAIVDQFGAMVDASNVASFGVVERLCSGSVFGPADGLSDIVFMTGEERSGGREFALDAVNRVLYEAPDLGNGAWENAAIISTVGTKAEGKTVVLLGDDTSGRPVWMYVGDQSPLSDGFMERNGLSGGVLYTFVLDSGANTNDEFAGTGNTAAGVWVETFSNNPTTDLNGDSQINRTDDIINANNMRAEAAQLGAFFFSRPEDVAAEPVDPAGASSMRRVVMASTGRVTNLGDIDGDGTADVINDPWGTTYIFSLDVDQLAGQGPIVGTMEIAYDANEPDKRDLGIRSADNLDWADDGRIYIQEDPSVSGFGVISGRESSIWRLDPVTHDARRVGEMDRSAVPEGQVDTNPNNLGNWESSGIVDVSALFGRAGGRLFLFDVQAHSVRGGAIDEDDLEQGGQILLLKAPECLADIDLDGDADPDDAALYLQIYLQSEPGADLNDDGDINGLDVGTFCLAYTSWCD